eukprot:363428-Chlamydomonas_euryale.AAC.10
MCAMRTLIFLGHLRIIAIVGRAPRFHSAVRPPRPAPQGSVLQTRGLRFRGGEKVGRAGRVGRPGHELTLRRPCSFTRASLPGDAHGLPLKTSRSFREARRTTATGFRPPRPPSASVPRPAEPRIVSRYVRYGIPVSARRFLCRSLCGRFRGLLGIWDSYVSKFCKCSLWKGEGAQGGSTSSVERVREKPYKLNRS